MSLITENQRESAVHVGIPWRGLYPVSDGYTNGNDRAFIAAFYAERISPLITSTNTIQKPVDYWLAGEPAPERMQLGKNIMRSIFRE